MLSFQNYSQYHSLQSKTLTNENQTFAHCDLCQNAVDITEHLFWNGAIIKPFWGKSTTLVESKLQRKHTEHKRNRRSLWFQTGILQTFYF